MASRAINVLMKTFIACVTAMVATAAISTAELAFEKTLIEFHPKPDTPHVTAEFVFKNSSDQAVRIAKYDAACACMEVKVAGNKLDYAPGEIGVIHAVFKLAGYYGTIDRVVAVWLDGDAPTEPTARLTLRAHIPQLVTLDPKTLSWDLNTLPEPKIISIEMDPEVGIQILGTQSSNDNFTLELKILEAGRNYELTVTPQATDTPGIAIFRIETDCETESQRVQTAFGVIRNPPR